MGLVSELRRRNVIRMAALYVVAAWLIMQVSGQVIELAHLPDWVGPVVLALLAIGFPIALIFSWFYEITPDGISLEKDVDRDASITHVTGRRIDFIVIALLSAAVIMFAIDKWWTEGPPENSIAVLPFTDMSPAGDHKYFSDGLAEELLNLLTRVQGLKVTSRTSSFSFVGTAADISQIAEALNVAYVLEGSVRRSGDRLRITAQLIDASSDHHLWSHTYDRQLLNIFEMQDEIAASVIDALKITLTGTLPESNATDPEAYSLYLQARHLWRLASPESIEQAHELLKRAIEIDPNYAPAWLGLGTIYTYQAALGTVPFEQAYAEAKDAAERALELDPGYAHAYSDLGWYAMTVDGDYVQAAEYFRAARRQAPRSAQVLGNIATFAAVIGRPELAAESMELAIEHDPVDSAKYTNLGAFHLLVGRYDEAGEAFSRAISLSPDDVWARRGMAQLRVLENRPDLAQEILDESSDEQLKLSLSPMILHDLGRADDVHAALDAVESSVGTSMFEYDAAEVYAYLGLNDQAFESLERAVASGEQIIGIRISPFLAKLADDARWETLLTTTGLSDAQVSQIVL